MRFAILGSGSRGNSTLVHSHNSYVLIDCGFSLREAERRLARLGVVPAQLDAVLVTHEHSDHVQGVELLARKHGVPVYYSAGTGRGLRKPVTAQGLLVNNEINALQVRLSRFTAAVTLIRALGGGWDVRSLPSDAELKGPTLPIDRGGQAVRVDE